MAPHSNATALRVALVLLVHAASGIAVVAKAEVKPELEVGGLLFGDIYHVVSEHDSEWDGASGVFVRRGYLTLDTALGAQLNGRLRFEINQSGEFETYDFGSRIKDLWVGVKLGAQQVIFGRSPSPTFDLIESLWGMRYLVRTPLDLQGIPSRGDGVSASGWFSASGTLGYRVMAAAGESSDDGVKWMGALTWKPTSGLYVDFYLDSERKSDGSHWNTRQIFASYRSEWLRWGVQYADQDRGADPPLQIASAYVVRRLSELASLVLRVDRLLEPSPEGDQISYLPFDPTARATFIVSGVEMKLRKSFRITPNVVYTTYDRNAQGVTPDSDLQLRFTLFLDLE